MIFNRRPILRLALSFIPAAAVLVGGVVMGEITPLLGVIVALAAAGGVYWCGAPAPVPNVTKPEPTPPDEETSESVDILNALPGPVLVLNSDRRIRTANQSALGQFGKDIVGQDLAMAVRQPEALRAAETVLSGKVGRAKASVTVGHSLRSYFEIKVQALPRNNPWKGAAIYALFDVTAVKEAEEMRADFVANVSHELRSPLTALIGFIETLQGSARKDSEARERFLGIMDGEAQRMRRLIADLLSLSRIEINEHVQPDETVNIVKLIKDVKDTLALRADDKGVEIKLSQAKKIDTVPGDRDQLTEVFHNLMENAIKYGREGQSVRVKVSMMDDMPGIRRRGVAVSVQDRGEGIEPDQIPRLTERFYRVDKGRSRAMGGTGLGLAIVKHILNRHQGRLVVESTVGEGSTFTVYLPV